MRRDFCDLHAVRPEHLRIHDRCLNWRRWALATGSRASWGIQPMFRHYRSSEVWAHEKPLPIDNLDGLLIEKAVFQLPEKHRHAVRWAYVFSYLSPGKVQRHLAVTREGLADLIHDGRSILKNRSPV